MKDTDKSIVKMFPRMNKKGDTLYDVAIDHPNNFRTFRFFLGCITKHYSKVSKVTINLLSATCSNI
jgi:hypothetical protein